MLFLEKEKEDGSRDEDKAWVCLMGLSFVAQQAQALRFAMKILFLCPENDGHISYIRKILKVQVH